MTGSERLVLSGGIINQNLCRLIVDQARVASGKDVPTILIDQSAKIASETFNEAIDMPDLFTEQGAATVRLQDGFFKTPAAVEALDRIEAADAIFVSDGSTRRLLERWHTIGILDSIVSRVEDGTMVAGGVGAGTLVWSAAGFSDSEQYTIGRDTNWKYVKIAGTGLLHARVNVQHEATDNLGRSRREIFERQLSHESDWRRAIALETGAGLVCTAGIATVVALDAANNRAYRYNATTRDIAYSLPPGTTIGDL